MTSLISNIKQFKRDLEKVDKARVKAYQTAVKVEVFRLTQELKKEIREGSNNPGLTIMAKALRRKNKRSPSKPPLYMLAPMVRYDTTKTSNGMEISFGFVDTGKGKPLPMKMIEKAQSGGTQRVTNPLVALLAKTGSKGRKRVNQLFLKKTTGTLKTPARPIIEPFWDAHKQEAEQNIILNFHRKMKGERI